MDKGAWWATVHRVAKSQMQLSTCATASMPGKRKCICIYEEKELCMEKLTLSLSFIYTDCQAKVQPWHENGEKW